MRAVYLTVHEPGDCIKVAHEEAARADLPREQNSHAGSGVPIVPRAIKDGKVVDGMWLDTHAPDYDDPYIAHGCFWCGRCHEYLGPQTLSENPR